MTEPERPLCRETTKAGNPCRNRAMPGSHLCGTHGGGSARPGRRSKLDDTMIDTITTNLRAGAYRDAAAQAAGIGTSTLYAWIERGEADLAADKPSQYRDLVEALTRAEGEAELRATAHVQAAMPDDWRAAAWYLERKHPRRWGRRRIEVDHSGEVRVGEPQHFAPDSDEKRAAVLAVLKETGILGDENTTD